MRRKHNVQGEEGTAAVLLGSMQAVQQSLRESNQVAADQLLERLQEWQQLVWKLASGVKRGEELASLYEVSQILNSSLDLPKTLDLVMDLLVHLTGAERGCLMLLDEDGTLQVRAGRHFDDDVAQSFDLQISHTVVQRAVESAEPILTTNAQIDPRFSQNESVVGYHLRSIICVPLHIRGRVIGALYLDNRMREGVFSDSDLPMLTAFANQAAVAIENARLYTTTDQALAAHVEELTTLQQIDRSLNASLDLKRILDLTLSWALRATGAEQGVLCMLTPEGDVQQVARSENGKPALPESEIVRLVMRSRDPLAIGRLRILVPIRFEQQVIGMLDLRNNGSLLFRPEHAQLAGRLADHAAVAIENARLYKRVREADRAKSEFVSFVAHELRSPMTSIRGYADMLEREMVGPLTDQQAKYVTIINDNVTRMQLLVSDLQDISRIETHQLRLDITPMPLGVALENASQALQGQVDSRGQVMTLDVAQDLPRVQADAARLTQVLVNLISNANKYTPEGGKIQIRAWANGQHVHCAVCDTGVGISPEDQACLFTKFFRSDAPEIRNMPGTGLGLCIVKNLIELQGGEITVESQVGQGTTFEFTMPIAE